jgi:hypothetical protein
MSDIPEPEKPSASPVGPAVTARPRPPLLRRRSSPRPAARPAVFPRLRLLIYFGGAILVAVHLVFGRDDFDLADRALAVIPLFPLLWELQRFLNRPSSPQLPFGVFALLMNYVNFSWPALFYKPFADLSGPMSFSPSVRFAGTSAVALNSLCIYAGLRLGEVAGTALQPSLLRIYPPAEVPSSFARALGIYALMSMAATEVGALGVYPGAVSALIAMSMSLTYVIGATRANPESFRGPWSRYLGWGAVAYGSLSGVLHGTLEPLFRLATTVMAARWVYARRFSVAGVVALLAVYALLQPAKGKFRAQIWTTRGAQEAPSYTDRVNAWTSSIDDLWSGRDAAQTSGDAAVSRFLELDPVLHAFAMLPGRVTPAEGQAWMNILYSPIPRIVWPDKPTTTDLTLNYGVAFNLQSTVGARTTAIMLSLIVDGYWNFGWPGIVFVSVLAGLWVGICQTMYTSNHWALRASAVAQFSQISITSSFALLYSGIVQLICGAIIASWMVYLLARLLAPKRASGARSLVGPGRAAQHTLPGR